MANQGTRTQLSSWLSMKKGMTYTKYSHLPTEKKLEIQKEYGQRGKKNESGQSSETQEGASPAVS